MSLNLILSNAGLLRLYMSQVLVARDRRTKLNRLMEKGEFVSSYKRKTQDLGSGIAGSRGSQRCRQNPISPPLFSSTCPVLASFSGCVSISSNRPSPSSPTPSSSRLICSQLGFPEESASFPTNSSRSPGLTLIDPNWVRGLSLGANHWGQEHRICGWSELRR